MDGLKPYYSKNGYDYALVKRTHGVAMFHQTDGTRHVAYEVGRIKVQKEDATMPGGQVVKAGERFWSNEDFGNTAWSILTLEGAMARFDELVATPPKQINA
jgi:hypothetical protein